jgi:3-polyprenyl-4-hydroxybenzoate decarboxylase
MGRYVVVVDDDIDPCNLREVIWALVSRTNPTSDILTFADSLGSPADPMKAGYEPGTLYSARAVIDACRPFKSLETFPPVAASSKEKLQAVRAKWDWLWPS